ncbi:hypothetical protein EK904_005837 [Melospiza melodia maxima]|nr:hypothetical protein EK904_005837 [Melospiza melodia maxima]
MHKISLLQHKKGPLVCGRSAGGLRSDAEGTAGAALGVTQGHPRFETRQCRNSGVLPVTPVSPPIPIIPLIPIIPHL